MDITLPIEHIEIHPEQSLAIIFVIVIVVIIIITMTILY